MFASWGPLAIPSAATLVVLLEVRFALCYVGIADERHVKQIVGRIIASGQRRLLVAIWVLVLFVGTPGSRPLIGIIISRSIAALEIKYRF